MTGFLALFVALLTVGMPVFLVLGLCAAAMFVASGQPLVGAAQLVINELNSPNLMALPLFVMAAAFMRFGGIAKALVDLAGAWLGGLPGDRSDSSPSFPVRCLRRSAGRASRPRWRWEPF